MEGLVTARPQRHLYLQSHVGLTRRGDADTDAEDVDEERGGQRGSPGAEEAKEAKEAGAGAPPLDKALPRDASRRGSSALPPRDGRIPRAVARAAIASRPMRGGPQSVTSADTDGLLLGPAGVVAVSDVLAPRPAKEVREGALAIQGTREGSAARLSPGVGPAPVPSPACVLWVAAGHEVRVEAPLAVQQLLAVLADPAQARDEAVGLTHQAAGGRGDGTGKGGGGRGVGRSGLGGNGSLLQFIPPAGTMQADTTVFETWWERPQIAHPDEHASRGRLGRPVQADEGPGGRASGKRRGSIGRAGAHARRRSPSPSDGQGQGHGASTPAEADLVPHPMRSLNPAQVAARMRAAQVPGGAHDQVGGQTGGRHSREEEEGEDGLSPAQRPRAQAARSVARLGRGSSPLPLHFPSGGEGDLLDGGQQGALDTPSVLSLEGDIPGDTPGGRSSGGPSAFGPGAGQEAGGSRRRPARLSPLRGRAGVEAGSGGHDSAIGASSASKPPLSPMGAAAGARRLSRSPSPSRLASPTHSPTPSAGSGSGSSPQVPPSPGTVEAQKSVQDAADASGLRHSESLFERELDRHEQQMEEAKRRQNRAQASAGREQEQEQG